MTLKITWQRTVIAGETAPEDFIAEDENGRTIGRIYATTPADGSMPSKLTVLTSFGRMVRHQARRNLCEKILGELRLRGFDVDNMSDADFAGLCKRIAEARPEASARERRPSASRKIR